MTMSLFALLLTQVAVSPVPAAPPLTPAAIPAPAATPAPSLPRVVLETGMGRIVIELETGRAPITAGNFLKYVDQKRLDGVKFYRTVKAGEKFGFVQFGVAGDPKRMLPPIAHERTDVTGVKHLNGAISTARFEPGSARGEFTISVGDQPSLDANPSAPADATRTNLGYAAFGRVVEGTDVIERIMNAPIDPEKTDQGSFKGEIPVAPVVVTSVRRVAN